MHRGFHAIQTAFHRPQSRSYRVVDRIVWALIAFSILLFAVELYLGKDHPQVHHLVFVDHIVLVLFGIEIGLRILTFHPPVVDFTRHTRKDRIRAHLLGRLLYCLRPLTLIDLLTVAALVPALRGLRAFRLLRLARSSRLFHYGSPLAGIMRAFRDNRLLFGFGLTLLLLCVLVGGLSIYLVEAGENPNVNSIGDGVWWALVTITTVGFGDIHPISTIGRMIGGCLMISGLFAIGLFAGIVGHTIVRAVVTTGEEHVRMSTFIKHVVICGYDPGARMLLDAILAELEATDQVLVVFSQGERPPDIPNRFIWVNGDPTKESELDRVRMAYASAAIVVGSRQVLPQHADAISIMTVFTIRSYLKHSSVAQRRLRPLHIVAEILDAENVDHAVTAGATEVIETTRLGFSLMAHATRMPGTASITIKMASLGAHSVYLGLIPDDISCPVAFGDLSDTLRARMGILAIGLIDPETMTDRINPDPSFLVNRDIQLIYLAEQPVLPPV
ncbi:MAG: ion transporter [Bradymonadales bacterium]|nr:ion transporter [Bradymonadales bacterium]